MKQLNDSQFSGYTFRTASERSGYTDAVALHHGEPIGSIQITNKAWSRQDEQRGINRGWDGEHREIEDVDGQMAWSRGNFDNTEPKVSWLGLHSEHRHPAVLEGLGAVAFAQHGYIPYADSTLSVEGAKISKGMNRKYGMKGHPDNPDFESSFDYGTAYMNGEKSVVDAMVTRTAFNHNDTMIMSERVRPRDWTHTEAHEVAQGLKAEHGKKPPKAPSVLSPGQMGLF
jgi:hypothetical protein